VDVRNAVSNVLADLFTNTCSCGAGGRLCHDGLSESYFFSASAALRGPLRVRAFVLVR
jgi:hypothetical protein